MMFLNGIIKDYTKQMPALPVSAKRVMDICGKMSVNAFDLNYYLSLDPVLTGRILQLLSISYKGLDSHITSLVRALTMLGVNTVKNLVISAVEQSIQPKDANANKFDFMAFWRHSLSVALITKHLAIKQNIDPVYHEEFYISGLLHDIGMLPLNFIFPNEYSILKNAVAENKNIITAEKILVGSNHCKAGEIIAKAWKLEWPVADVIAWHHEPSLCSGKNTTIVFTVAIADYFSSLLNMGALGLGKSEKPDFQIWMAAGLKEEDFEEIREAVCEEFNKAQRFLSIS